MSMVLQGVQGPGPDQTKGAHTRSFQGIRQENSKHVRVAADDKEEGMACF